MQKLVFADAYFFPAKVHWNRLVVDPDQRIEPQMDEFWDDPFFAVFPNGVRMTIDWNPLRNPPAFVIELAQEPWEDWVPFCQREARSVEELRQTVQEVVDIARARRSIARQVFYDSGIPKAIVTKNELVLDHVAPPASQVDRLGESLFIAYWRNGCFLTIGWRPPHDRMGRFVVSLEHDPRGYAGIWDDIEAGDFEHTRHPRRIMRQYDCTTIDELKQAVSDAAELANAMPEDQSENE